MRHGMRKACNVLQEWMGRVACPHERRRHLAVARFLLQLPQHTLSTNPPAQGGAAKVIKQAVHRVQVAFPVGVSKVHHQQQHIGV